MILCFDPVNIRTIFCPMNVVNFLKNSSVLTDSHLLLEENVDTKLNTVSTFKGKLHLSAFNFFVCQRAWNALLKSILTASESKTFKVDIYYEELNIFSFFLTIQPLTHVDGTHVLMEDFVFLILLPIVSPAPVQPVLEEPDVNLVRYQIIVFVFFFACNCLSSLFMTYTHVLRGYCTSYQKSACFVLYLKIINNLLKNKVCILLKMVQRTQKWYWNFSRPNRFKL